MGQETFLRVGIDGSAAKSGARVVTRSMDDISNSAQTVGKHVAYLQSALTHLAGTAVGVYGIATALQAIKAASLGVLDYLGKIETATLGIAAAYLVSGQYQDTITKKALSAQTALKAAQNESAAVIEQLKVANFQTIATLDQLIFAYQVTLPVAMSAGFNKQQVMDYTLAMVQAAGAIGLSFDQIAEETRSMLTGNITRNSRIAQVLGLRNEDVTALKGNATGLFDMLMGRLSGFRVAGIEAQKTWAGLLSNTKDIALQLSGKAFEPVFDAVKQKLVEIQKATFTIAKDSSGLQSIKFSDEFIKGAKEAAEFLKAFANGLISSATFIYDHAGAIKALVEIYIGFRLTVYAATLAQKASNIVSLEGMAIENSRRALAVQDLGIAAQAAKAEATKTAAAVAYQQARVAENAAERAGIVLELQSASSTEAAATASYAKVSAKLAEAAAEVASLTAVRGSLEAERALIVAKMASNDATAIGLANQQASIVAKQATRAATIAETQQLITQKQAIIAKWESELFFEGRSLTQSSGLNLVKQQEVNLRRSLTTHVNNAAKAELALVAINEQSIAAGLAKKALINQLVPLAVQQNGLEQQLKIAVIEHSTAERIAGSAITERGLAAKKLVVAEAAQLAIEANLAKATAANALAQGASTVATDLHTAAIAAQTIGARLATGAVTMLKSAMMYLGGPIGTIITLLGIAATAWFTFGKSARDANAEALEGADDVLSNLRKQNKELLERKRIQRAAGADWKDGKLNEGVFTDKELADLKRKEEMKRDLEAKLAKMPNFEMKKVVDTRGGATAQDSSTALKMQISSVTRDIEELRRLKKQNVEMEKETEYKSNDPKDKQDSLSASRKYYDALYALQRANADKAIAGYKELAARNRSILEDNHEQALVATTEYHKKKMNIEKGMIQEERNANTALLNFLKNSAPEAISAKDDPTGTKSAAMALEHKTKIIVAETKAIELEKQYNNVTIDGNIAIGKSNRDLMAQQEELNAQALEASGNTLGAGLATLNNQAARLEMAKAEIEVTAAAAAHDDLRLRRAQKTVTLLQQTKQLKQDQLMLDEQTRQLEPQMALLNEQGNLLAAVELNQALEKQSAAYKDLAAKGGMAFQAKQKLMELDRIKARQDEENTLAEIKNKNRVDEADLKAAQAGNTKGFGFGAINAQAEAEKVAISAKYELERKAITDKIELLQTGSSVEIDLVGSLMNAQLTALDTVHQATMAAIAAENEARYFNQPKLLEESQAASIAAEAKYQAKMADLSKSANNKLAAEKINTNKNSGAVIAALQQSLTNLLGKQQQETLTTEQKATRSKMSMVAAYGDAAGSIFTALADTQDQSSRKGFESAKQYNLAAAVMSTAAAIMNAFASLPWPAAPIAAALAAATGVVQIAKIASTTFGGGGSVSTPSTGSFGGGGASGIGTTASSIGGQVKSANDTLTEDSLRALAKASDNASLAISKVADGLTSIADLFKTGYSQNIAKGLTTPEGQVAKGVFSQTWTDMKDNFGTAIIDNLMGGMTAAVGVGASLIRHAFGIGNKWQSVDSGITLGLKNGEVEGQAYEDRKKSGGWFGKNKSRTVTSELGSGFNGVLDDFLGEIKHSISLAAVAMGAKTNFAQAQLGTVRISTAGKSPEDIQKEMEAFYRNAANELAKTTEGLQEFTFYGEDAFDSIIRLSTSLQGVNAMFELTGHTLIEASFKGADAAYRLADAFGGLEEMEDRVNDYFTSMFTESEQKAMKAATASRQVNTAFSEMGISVPKTNREFITLVDSLDVTTERGASLYVALMNIAPAFATVTEAATEAAEKLSTAFIDNALAAANKLKDIMGGALSTLTPKEQLMQQQAAFASALASGNTAGAIDISTALLEASRVMYGSGTGYQQDYENVTRALASIAGMDGQLSMDAVERQIKSINDTKDAIEAGTVEMVKSIAELKAAIVEMQRQQAVNTATIAGATAAGADTVADAVTGTLSAQARA